MIQFLLFFFLHIINTISIASEYRTYNGANNNKKHPNWGQSNTPFARHFPPSDPQKTPNPIQLSELARRTTSQTQEKTILNAGFGQFIAHDLGFMLPKSKDTIKFGSQSVPFKRANAILINNAEQQINDVSHWLDGSVIYGSQERHQFIAKKPHLIETKFGLRRAFDDAKILGNKQKTLSTGDVRGNDNPFLMQFQILFVKEHNRWVDKLSHLELDSQTLFEEARRRVIAVLQHLTFDEFLPLLLGQSLPEYEGYDDQVFPNVENFFSAVAMRFAHSNIIDRMQLKDEDGQNLQNFSIKDNSYLWESTDSKTLFVSMSFTKEKRTNIGSLFIQNMMTHQEESELEIRARDSQVSNYLQGKVFKQARKFYLNEKKNPQISQILNNCENKDDILRMYDFKIDKIDSLVGILCEQPQQSRFIGPTAAEAIKQTFLKLRSGDRFWYEKDLDKDEIQEIKSLKLSDIIRLNFNIENMRENVLQI